MLLEIMVRLISFSGMGPILITNGNCWSWNYYFNDWINVVKIKSNDAKEKQVMGALNVGNWVSIALVAVSCYCVS